MKNWICALLVLCFMWGSSAPAYVYAADDTVSTGNELVEWFSDHKKIGGTVTLTDNIEINTEGSVASLSTYAPVTVDAGPYSISIKDTQLALSGEIHFIGEGVTSPIFLVQDDSILSIPSSVSVTALGDGVQGGQAIYIDNRSSFRCFGKVAAFGTGAVAVHNDGEYRMEIQGAEISAFGTDSIAIASRQAVTTSFSVITAEGPACIVTSSSAITLDTSIASPEVTDATVITRAYSTERGAVETTLHLDLDVQLGAKPEDLFIPFYTDYYFTNLDAEDPYYDYEPGIGTIEWEPFQLDTSKLGTTTIHGTYDATTIYSGNCFSIQDKLLPLLAPADVDLKNAKAELTVHVIQPYKPDIKSGVSQYNEDTLLMFFPEYIDSDTATLWFTEDSGQTWTDITKEDWVMLDSGMAMISGLQQGKVYGFQLEAYGSGMAQGMSDVLAIELTSGIVPIYPGIIIPPVGDRGGTSVEPQAPRPTADTEVPSRETPTPGGQTGGGSTQAPHTEAPTTGGQTGGGNTQVPSTEAPTTGGQTGGGNTQAPHTEAPTTEAPTTGGQTGNSTAKGIGGGTTNSDKTVLNGIQIKHQVAVYPKTVPFINNGIKLHFPSQSLLDLKLKDADRLSVAINKRSDKQFSVEILINGKSVVPPPFGVSMPYQPKQNARFAQLVLTDAQGKPMPLSFYDQATGRMTATLYQSGVYTVEEVNAPSFSDCNAPSEKSDVTFLAARGIVHGYGHGLFLPNAQVTHSEFLTMLAALYKPDTLGTQVPNGKWYAPMVNWATKNKLAAPLRINMYGPVTVHEANQYLSDFAKLLGTSFTAPTAEQDVYLTRAQTATLIKEFITRKYAE